MPKAQWLLRAQARMWRTLMAVGMFIHRLAPPRPPPPSFSRIIPTAISPNRGTVKIQFYVPKDYNLQRNLRTKKYPVVVNFHGGGFTIGTATDDARWAHTVVDEVGAVVASVDYRLAPEYPFPTAVEDGVDALIYISKHSEELNLDPDRIAVSGFSAGGNMAFTVPLRLQEELDPSLDTGSPDTELAPSKSVHQSITDFHAMQAVKVAAIVAWYPSADYTRTREQRRKTMVRVDQALPAFFTELFDDSYLQPPSMNRSNPYLSPALAPQGMLSALPDEILMYTCEWDMLRAEGQRLKARLEELGKRVVYKMVPEVAHGWDKGPNPISPTPKAKDFYLHACRELRRIFNSSRASTAGEADEV